jgi:hypothetical protein
MQELRGLVVHHLKEKLLVQEARALGLEIDDAAGLDRLPENIRRRR